MGGREAGRWRGRNWFGFTKGNEENEAVGQRGVWREAPTHRESGGGEGCFATCMTFENR